MALAPTIMVIITSWKHVPFKIVQGETIELKNPNYIEEVCVGNQSLPSHAATRPTAMAQYILILALTDQRTFRSRNMLD
jgi:hypothetical protein